MSSGRGAWKDSGFAAVRYCERLNFGYWKRSHDLATVSTSGPETALPSGARLWPGKWAAGSAKGVKSPNNLGWKGPWGQIRARRAALKVRTAYLRAHTGKGTRGCCCSRDTSGTGTRALTPSRVPPQPAQGPRSSLTPPLALGSLSHNPGVPRERQAPLARPPRGDRAPPPAGG